MSLSELILHLYHIPQQGFTVVKGLLYQLFVVHLKAHQVQCNSKFPITDCSYTEFFTNQ